MQLGVIPDKGALKATLLDNRDGITIIIVITVFKSTLITNNKASLNRLPSSFPWFSWHKEFIRSRAKNRSKSGLQSWACPEIIVVDNRKLGWNLS